MNKSNNGLSFCNVLAIVFIVLKVTKLINWSWLWVLCPIWIPFILIALAILVYVGRSTYEELKTKRSKRIKW